MARKLEPNPTAAPPQDDGADDLSILHPERDITIGGRQLTVREYGFREGIELERQPDVAAILGELTEIAQQPEGETFEQMLGVLTRHPDELTALMAQAADVGVDWINDRTQVSDSEGQALLMTWWLVNSGFFVRRVMRRLATRYAKQARGSATPTSTSASSSTGTTPAPSAPTPDAS